MRLSGQPLRQKPQQIVLTRLKLRPAQATPEKLVDEPDAIGADHIGFTVGRDLRNPTLAHIPLDFTAIHPIRLPRECQGSAQVIKAGLGALIETCQGIAEVSRILGVAIEVGSQGDCPGAETRLIIARYRSTGRSKLDPLNVTNCGRNSAMRSTKLWIRSASVRSEMFGAPRLRTIHTPSIRSAIKAPMQTILWKINRGNFSPSFSRAAASSASSIPLTRATQGKVRHQFDVPDNHMIEGALHCDREAHIGRASTILS